MDSNSWLPDESISIDLKEDFHFDAPVAEESDSSGAGCDMSSVTSVGELDMAVGYKSKDGSLGTYGAAGGGKNKQMYG